MPAPAFFTLFAPAPDLDTTAALTLAAAQDEIPASEPAPPGPFSSMWFPILMMVGIFWLFVIGPERKQRKKRETMLGALEKGHKVLTTSGIYGQVQAIQDNVVTLAVADGVRMRFARHAIQTVLDGEGEGGKDDKASK